MPRPRPSLSVCAPYNSETGRSETGLSDATLHVPYSEAESQFRATVLELVFFVMFI